MPPCSSSTWAACPSRARRPSPGRSCGASSASARSAPGAWRRWSTRSSRWGSCARRASPVPPAVPTRGSSTARSSPPSCGCRPTSRTPPSSTPHAASVTAAWTSAGARAPTAPPPPAPCGAPWSTRCQALPAHPVALEEAAAALWRGPLVRVFGWAEREGVPSQYGRRQPSEIASVLAGRLRAARAPGDQRGAPRARHAPRRSATTPDDRARPGRALVRRGPRAAARARGSGGRRGSRWGPTRRGGRRRRHSGGRRLRDAPGAGQDAAPGHAWPLVVQPNFEVLAYLDRLDAAAVAALTCATAVRIDPNTAALRARPTEREPRPRPRPRRRRRDRRPARARGGGARQRRARHARLGRAARPAARHPRCPARRVRRRGRPRRRPGDLPRARAVGERFALLPPRAKAPAGERHRYRDAPERGIAVDAAGNVRVTGALDLAGRAVVHALTRVGPRGRRAFDPDAIRAGPLPGGWRDVLKARLAKAMPAHVDALLRAWSGDGPPPALQGAVLFRHPRASAWAQHPRLAPYLGAALNDATYLVAVEAVAPLLAALRELGVEVDAPAGTGGRWHRRLGCARTGRRGRCRGRPSRHRPQHPARPRAARGGDRRAPARRAALRAGARELRPGRPRPPLARQGAHGPLRAAAGAPPRLAPLPARATGRRRCDDDEELIRIGYVEAIA
jgi:hypothetical protein